MAIFPECSLGRYERGRPRPESEDWVKNIPNKRKSTADQPGITGPSQLKYRNEEKLLSGEDWQQKYLIMMKDKLSIDLKYFAENSFLRDLKIIIKPSFETESLAEYFLW